MRIQTNARGRLDRVTSLFERGGTLGAVTLDLDLLTSPLSAFRIRAVPSPWRAAVYIAWDHRWSCRYVGSARRSKPGAAVDRVHEHIDDGRTDRWAAVTVLPLRPNLTLEEVRHCEAWAAWHLTPLEGRARPSIRGEGPGTLASL